MQQQTPVLDVVDNDEIDLQELVGVILAGWKLIVSISLGVVALGLLYAWSASRIYVADALIQIEEDQQPLDAALGDMTELFGVESPVAAEIELLKSRMIVGQVVDDLRLAIRAEPAYFPLFGRALTRSYEPALEAPVADAPLAALRSYAWGGESIRVTVLDLPRRWMGKSLTLRVLENQSYLISIDGQEIVRGTVGVRAEAAATGGQSVVVFVQELIAAPETEFELIKYERINVINDLTKQLNVVEKGKDSGILSVSLEGEDPRLTAEIVNHLVNAYQRQNVERKSAEAAQTLEFLNKQLPELRSNLEGAEAALNAYRLKQGSADLSMETELVLQQSVELETSRVALVQKREEALQRFTTSHPTVQVIDRQLQQVRDEQQGIEDRVKRLPETQQELLRFARDVEVNTALYTQLLNSAQELQVVKAGTVGNVRIVDHALVAIEPSKPKVPLVLALSGVLGVFLGLVVVFVRRALHSGVDDPALVERQLGLATYSSIPYAAREARIQSLLKRGRPPANRLLVLDEPDGVAAEALRSLRTALHFGQMDARNNVLMLTGPAPGLGKSFVSANLAAIVAMSGQRVALVDCDLRRGHIHDYFSVARDGGVSDFVSRAALLDDILKPTPIDGLTFVSTGTVPPNPAELLLSKQFEELLRELSSRYDMVILDTPPVLAVTDAVVIGRHAGTTLLVLKSGEHHLRAIDDTVKRLMTAGIAVRGTVFNQVGRHGQGRYGYKYGYSYGYYNYRYKSES